MSLLENEKIRMYATSAMFAVVYSVVRLLLTKVLYEPTGKLLIHTSQKETENGKNNNLQNGKDNGKLEKENGKNGHLSNGQDKKFKAQMAKWNESCWKSTIFGFLTVMEVIAVWGEPWLTDHTLYFQGCKQLPCLLPRTQEIINLYTVALGFYMYALPALVFWETRRKDFWASFLHHVVTLVLIIYSDQLNLTRAGTAILLVHDVDDVWLEIAKLCRYANKEVMMNIVFGIFTLFWFATRVFYLPMYIIRSTLFESAQEGKRYSITITPHWEILNGLLIVLWILHVYWSYFIVKVLIKALSGKVDDVREDDDDDHED
eukprot:TRINITY_DN1380_c1_g1_i1.p1 TRINITY_DN1380_c1_g1~~TRINITY_DN1380_c1_g1_i1.p1  ORF type:complete len:351 (-),score=27.59 TRINITY_DN1380_c1_g1_i1:276-1226(-)